jgi:ubiquinone biosynthesis protein COQ9
MSNTQKIRDQILSDILPDVVFDGWSWQAIEKSAEKHKIDPLELKAAFPNEIIDVLDAFADKTDRAMLDILAKHHPAPEELKIRDRIHAAIMARFQALEPDKEAVKASLKFWLNPLNKPRAAKILWRTADRIWTWAGDTSTDYNHYTKRGILSGILAPAMMVWINDHSDSASKTDIFVRARIENVMQMGGTIGKLKDFISSKTKGAKTSDGSAP